MARSGFRRRLVAMRHAADVARDAVAADEQVVLHEDQTVLLAALRRLPRRQRECVVLRYWQDLSDAEIAAVLGISINSVKTHQRRALRSLETMLETP